MLVTYCFDVGSVKSGSFGWAKVSDGSGVPQVVGGPAITDLVRSLNDDVRAKNVITLGIESPLFLPIPESDQDLNSGRDGERDRSCFAQVGATVTTVGLHELAYVLTKLDRRGVEPLIDWTIWNQKTTSTILFWEAFVSGQAHTEDREHRRDAATAAVEFLQRTKDGRMKSDVNVEAPSRVLSLVGTALIWAGWSTDLALLRQAALVVKPKSKFTGPIVDHA